SMIFFLCPCEKISARTFHHVISKVLSAHFRNYFLCSDNLVYFFASFKYKRSLFFMVNEWRVSFIILKCIRSFTSCANTFNNIFHFLLHVLLNGGIKIPNGSTQGSGVSNDVKRITGFESANRYNSCC